jgi:hypothetical protein
MYAAERGHMSIVEMLVAFGADVRENGNLLAYICHIRRHTALLEFLVARGADVADGIRNHSPEEEEPEHPRVSRKILEHIGDTGLIVKAHVLLRGMSKDNITELEREDAADEVCQLCSKLKSEVPLSPSGKLRNMFVVLRCDTRHIFCRECITRWVESDQGHSHLCPLCKSVIAVDDTAPSAAVGGGGAAAAAATCCSGGDVRGMCFTHRPDQPSPADISRILACPHTPWAAAWWLENDDADICVRALRGDFSALDTVLGGHLTPELKEAIKGIFAEENFDDMIHTCHTCGKEDCVNNGFRRAEHGEVVNKWFCESCFPKCFTCQSEEVVEHPEADKWYCEAHKMREEPPGSGHFRSGH